MLYLRGTHGVMAIVVGSKYSGPCSNPGQSCLYFLNANTLGKRMNLIIPFLRIAGQTEFLNFCMATDLGEGKL